MLIACSWHLVLAYIHLRIYLLLSTILFSEETEEWVAKIQVTSYSQGSAVELAAWLRSHDCPFFSRLTLHVPVDAVVSGRNQLPSCQKPGSNALLHLELSLNKRAQVHQNQSQEELSPRK